MMMPLIRVSVEWSISKRYQAGVKKQLSINNRQWPMTMGQLGIDNKWLIITKWERATAFYATAIGNRAGVLKP